MATFRKRGAYQWQAQVRKKGQPLQTKTFETRALAEQWARAIEVEMDKGMFVSRAEAESTTLKELLERYLTEVTPLKKGAASETNRLRALMRLPLARRLCRRHSRDGHCPLPGRATAEGHSVHRQAGPGAAGSCSRSPARNGASTSTTRSAISSCRPTTGHGTGACRPVKKPACLRPAARHAIPGCCPSCNWRWRPPCARGN